MELQSVEAMKAAITKVMEEWIQAEAIKGFPVQAAEALEMYSMLEKVLLLYKAEIQRH
jgi:hypothetical protein